MEKVSSMPKQLSAKKKLMIAVYLRTEFEVLCLKYGIKDKPLLVSDSSLNKTYGAYAPDRDRLAINMALAREMADYSRTLRHEFRHAWQQRKHPEQLEWVLMTHKDLYESNYEFYYYSPVEMDARLFAKTGKGMAGILSRYTPEVLDKLLAEGKFISEMKKVAERYNVPCVR